MELLDLKNDLVFQRLFGKSENKEITRHFLSLILGREINNIDLDVNKRMLRNNNDSKTCRLDVRAKFNDGEDCNIELQVAPYAYMAKRMLQYWSGMYENKLGKGQDYSILKPSISILITDYLLDETAKFEDYHTIWNLREKKHTDTILSNDIEIHILEIPKIKKNEITNDELVQWLRFIDNPKSEEIEKVMEENRFLKQAKEELAYLSGEPDFQLEVEARAGMLMDIYCMKKKSLEDGEKIGKQKGYEEGKKEEKINLAKKLKANKMPIEEIIELTELTREEIEKL